MTRHAGAIRKGVTDPYGNIAIQDIEIQFNINSAYEIKMIKDNGE